MNDTIKREDATETFAELYDIFDDYPNIIKELHKVYDKILAIPSAENKSEWIENAISIIDDMQSEGIVDYEQAREFRMRARMKGIDDD